MKFNRRSLIGRGALLVASGFMAPSFITRTAMALDSGVSVRDVDVKLLQQKLRAQGADPGDHSEPNPDLPSIVRQDHDLELIA